MYNQKTIGIFCIILLILNLLIYINSEYLFKMTVYLFSRDRYYQSLLNLGYSPLTFGNTQSFKYSNELYTIIINSINQYTNNITKLNIVEVPCMNANSGSHILTNFNPHKLICITPHQKFIDVLEPFTESYQQINYKLGNIQNLSKLKLNKKEIDLVISIEPTRHGYKLNELSSQITKLILPKKHWIIADIIKTTSMKQLLSFLKKDKFKILKTIDVSQNIINSIDNQHINKNNSITTFPVIKEFMNNLLITKNSNIYKNLLNKSIRYLIIIATK